MVALNSQYNSLNVNMAVDAADTLYAGQTNLLMFSASNNYSSTIATMGVAGYAGGVSLAPDGTIYVQGGINTINIIDRSQGSIDFGSNNGQTSNPYTMTLYNGGNQPLTISSIVASGAGYSVQPYATNPCSTSGTTVIAVGAICQFNIAFTQPHGGTSIGTITITSNSLNHASTVQAIALTAEISGIYVSAAPNPLVFPTQTESTSATLPVTLTNYSVGSNAVGYGSTVSITSALVSSNPAFVPSLGTCSSSLASVSTCQLQVAFNPSLAQSYSGTITWTESLSGGPSQQLSVAVSGSSVPPPIVLPLNELIHTSDSVLLTPSFLLPLNEVVHVSDNLAATPSFLLPLNETVHVSDALQATPVPSTSTVLTAGATVVAAGGTLTLTATVTAQGATAVPTGNITFLQDGSVVGLSPLSSGAATFTTAALDAGSHTFQALYSGSSQFIASNSSVVTVSATTLNVLTVAAQSYTRSFGSTNPSIGYQVTGFVNGDNSAVLSGQPSITTAARLNSPAGTYPIAISAGTLVAPSRYALNFVAGTLTITGNASQIITFFRLPDVPLSAVHSLSMTAHSSSGLPITYTVSGPASVSGNMVTLQSSGTVTVTASQSGNSTFASAAPVVRSFQVTP